MFLTTATIPMMGTLAADPLQAALANGSAWLSAFARTAAPQAIAALWQGSAIAFVLGLCLRFAPHIHLRLGAAQRFAVWAAAFATIAVLPLLPSFAIHGFFGYGAIVPSGAASPAQAFHFPCVQISERWALGLAAVWLVASLARAAGLIRHSFHLRRFWNSATPIVLDENLRGLLAASGARRRIELCTTRTLDRPSVIGFFAPRILIPEWLFSRLTADELDHVVLHEAEHLRRGDDWINLLQKLALVLFPLNPALVWIERRLCREREMACDEGVVRRTQTPRAYAASLANLAGHAMAQRHAHALSLGAFERRSELAHRVSSLLARKPTLHPLAARALVVVSACGLLAASLELARCPQIVAFVPAAPAANVAPMDLPTSQAEGDRVYTQPIVALSASGLRALPAKAILPPSKTALPHVPSSSNQSNRSTAESHASSGRGLAAREVQLKAEMPDPNTPLPASGSEGQIANARVTGQAEFVVLTTWEEVATLPRRAAPTADYDTDAAAQPRTTDSQAPSANQTSGHPSVQITVTRLIFWVAPRTSTSNSAAFGSKLPHSTTPASRPLPAPIAESGWLVFQL